MSTEISLQAENDLLRQRIKQLESQLQCRSAPKSNLANELLDGLVEVTAKATGQRFFSAFVSAVARIFKSRYVLICENIDDPVTRVRTLAFWMGDQLGDNIEYDLSGVPCEKAAHGEMVYYPSGIQEAFPEDLDLVTMEAESYCGIPLKGSHGKVIGHIAILDDRPMDTSLCEVPALAVFVSRAESELERKGMEQALRESKNSLQSVIESAPVVFTAVNRYGLIEMFDGGAVENVGLKPGQFTGEDYFELWKDVPHLADSMKNCLDGIPTQPTLTEVHGRQLETRVSPIFNEQGEITGATSVCVDATERIAADVELRRLREKLAHVTRVSSVGEMASGLAHELNQPLSAIATYAFICQRFVESGNTETSEFHEALSKLADQALRAGEIIRRIRALVENRQFKTEWVDIANPIHEVTKLLEPSLRSQEIELKLHLNHGNKLAPLDEIQIQQVLLNLLQNAIEAIQSAEENATRVIEVHTEVGPGRISQEEAIVVRVSDSGPGFDVDSQQVFDTFFTTKKEGIGMGLSISKSIVSMHNGHLRVVPGPKQGATFEMELPTQKD